MTYRTLLSVFFSFFVLFSTESFAKTLATVNGHAITDNRFPDTSYLKLPADKQKLLIEQEINKELLIEYLMNKPFVNSPRFSKLFKRNKAKIEKKRNKRLNKEQTRYLKGLLAIEFYKRELAKNTSVSETDISQFYLLDKQKAGQTPLSEVKISIYEFLRNKQVGNVLREKLNELHQTAEIKK